MRNEYQRGDVVWADLGIRIGSEQEGERPVLVVQNNIGNRHSPTVTVISLSTQIPDRNYPFHARTEIADRIAVIKAEQIITIDKSRLGDVIVHLEPDIMLQVDEAIRFQLALILCPSCGNPLKDQFDVCPFCHTVLKKNCASCGTMLDVNWIYCPLCGTKNA
jgi:mRNA interferase MazF